MKMNRLMEFDFKAKRLVVESFDEEYKEINMTQKRLVKYLEDVNFKKGVEVQINYGIFSGSVGIDISVEDIDKDITTKQMYQLTEQFKDNFGYELDYVISIEEMGKGDYYEYGVEAGSVYEIYHTQEDNQTVKKLEKYKQFVQKELGKKYNFGVITYLADGTKNVDFDYKYGHGFEELTDKERIMSRYLSTKLDFVEDNYTKAVSDKVRGESVGNKLGIKEDIEYVRGVFEQTKIKDNIRGTGMLKDLRYGVKIKRGRVILDIIVEGYDLNMNYLNGRNYKQTLNTDKVNHIDVNIVVRNMSIPDTLTGSYSGRENRQDEVIRQKVVSAESIDLNEDVNEVVKDTVGTKKSDINKGFGSVLIDITKPYDLTIIEEYGWVQEFMAFNNGDLVLHVSNTDGSTSLNAQEKEELNKNLTLRNANKLYDYLIKTLVK